MAPKIPGIDKYDLQERKAFIARNGCFNECLKGYYICKNEDCQIYQQIMKDTNNPNYNGRFEK
jgi:hypothetical protein